MAKSLIEDAFDVFIRPRLESTPPPQPASASESVLNALVKTSRRGVPSTMRVLDPGRAQSDGPGFARHLAFPAAQAGLLAVVELLVDQGDFLLDGADPLSVLAAAGLSLREANKKLDRVLDGIDRIEGRLERMEQQLARIEEKVNRIDAAVQEQDLRRDVSHLLKKHRTGNEIAIEALCTELVGSLDRFERIFGNEGLRLGDGIGLTFTAQTKDTLQHLYRLLRGLRLARFADANAQVGHDPSRTFASDPVADYWPATAATTSAFVLRFQVGELLRRARDMAAGHGGNPMNFALTPHAVWEGVDRELSQPVRRWTQELDGDSVRIEEAYRGDIPGNNAYAWIEAFRPWWLYRTDAGLLWRVRKEVTGLLAAYEPFLQGEKLPPAGQILLGAGKR